MIYAKTKEDRIKKAKALLKYHMEAAKQLRKYLKKAIDKDNYEYERGGE